MLRQRGRLIVQRVRACRRLHHITAQPRIQLKDGARSERSCERRGEVDAALMLLLVLSGGLLVECVGRLKDRAGRGQIQLNARRREEAGVEAVEDVATLPRAWNNSISGVSEMATR